MSRGVLFLRFLRMKNVDSFETESTINRNMVQRTESRYYKFKFKLIELSALAIVVVSETIAC